MKGTSRARERREHVGVCAVVAAAALLVSAPPAAQASTDVLYVTGTNSAADNVVAHRITSSGALVPLAGPFTAGTNAEGVTITPDARRLYVANFISANVSGFTIEGADGTLTPTPGSPYPAAAGPTSSTMSLASSPDGRHVFASNFGTAPVGLISAYDVGAGGALTQVAGSPVTSGAQPVIAAVTPDGRFLYSANYASGGPVLGVDDDISGYEISPAGSLTPLPGSPFAAGDGPVTASVTPDGRYLYVANAFDDNVSGYAIGGSGALTPVPGSPAPAGGNPSGQAIAPDGRYLYVASFDDNNLSGYAIAGDGALNPLPGSPFPISAGPGNPNALAMTADGRHLYATHRGSSNIDAFDVSASGALTPIAGSPFPTGVPEPSVFSIAITPNQPPRAAFRAKAQRPGKPARFDATRSSDVDGTPARYDWDFGDGKTLEDAGAEPKHRYAAAGRYTVTLTVTDDEGCSTTFVFTGQTAYCNGGPSAQTTRKLRIKPKLEIVRVKDEREQAKLVVETNVGGSVYVDKTKNVKRSKTATLKRAGRARLTAVGTSERVNARVVFKARGAKRVVSERIALRLEEG